MAGGVIKSIQALTKWVFLLTLFMFLIVVVSEYRRKRENYTELHRRVKNVEIKLGIYQ